MVHKALELLARRKKSEQDGERTFVSDGKLFFADKVTPESAADEGFWHYQGARGEGHEWGGKDLDEVRRLVEKALDMNEGRWDPLKRTIVEPEQFFEFELTEPWARYDFETPFGRLVGNLKLRGTLDLICEADDLYELVDWKTGQRKNWATGEVKDYKALMRDKQLLFYYYALRRLYPDRAFFITIVFIRHGGAFTLPYGDREYELAKKMLRSTVEELKSVVRPKLNKSFACTSFCHHGITTHPQSGRTLCEHYKHELQQVGMEKLIRENGITHLERYSGGGRDGG